RGPFAVIPRFDLPSFSSGSPHAISTSTPGSGGAFVFKSMADPHFDPHAVAAESMRLHRHAVNQEQIPRVAGPCSPSRVVDIAEVGCSSHPEPTGTSRLLIRRPYTWPRLKRSGRDWASMGSNVRSCAHRSPARPPPAVPA